MWPSITYETCAWNRDYDDLALIPKGRRRKILPIYEAAVPAAIAQQAVSLSPELERRIAEVEVAVARFDEAQGARDWDLPALLLRSESSSSSQIERLTSSVSNVALAELTEKAPANALLIAGNVVAMREAVGQSGPVSIGSICSIHDALMAGTAERRGLRNEQVWIGGSPYSPHGASFVPPYEKRIPGCLDDLIAFGGREDVSPVAKAAIFHAQFETIHPFTDGNGRTGRALVHRMLANDEILLHSTLPVSAGLLHDVGRYMGALNAYHAGDIEPMICCLVDALELAVVIGSRIAFDVDAVLDAWSAANTDRAGSASHDLPALLVEQPVVNVAYVAEHLEITDRAARSLVETACERGILSKMGNAKRGAFYQAGELIGILEEVSSLQGIRRIAAR
ncbi:Fic family protein [Paraeggerthella hongkongensis]|uniref:Fic family protein n=1 Tax=Paraeggerthella hominis TaxID=2897351 RepID=UPI001C0FA79A|nr:MULTISPECIES: Fic family protein [Paraeggerthella]MBU5406105.1 Fic family protein [Paraeggerthella hongkongensis]MCD2433954.1 Fic family protein [Paraeggerthella hominis]